MVMKSEKVLGCTGGCREEVDFFEVGRDREWLIRRTALVFIMIWALVFLMASFLSNLN